MFNELDIIKNISSIYDSNNSLRILKDFERVLDELNLYVFKNWEDGELVSGPEIGRHWVECSFLWPEKNMPDPSGGKLLLDYGCKVSYKKDMLVAPRKIKKPSDFRPSSKKGKLDKHPIWIVNIKMPKSLIFDIFKGTVKDSQNDQVDLESIYQYNDVAVNAPTNVAADANAQEPVSNEPTV